MQSDILQQCNFAEYASLVYLMVDPFPIKKA